VQNLYAAAAATTVYAPLDCVWVYPGEPLPERQNQEGRANLDLLQQEWQWHQLGHVNTSQNGKNFNSIFLSFNIPDDSPLLFQVAHLLVH